MEGIDLTAFLEGGMQTKLQPRISRQRETYNGVGCDLTRSDRSVFLKVGSAWSP